MPACRDEVTASANAWHDAREQLNRVKTLAERKSSLSSQRAEVCRFWLQCCCGVLAVWLYACYTLLLHLCKCSAATAADRRTTSVRKASNTSVWVPLQLEKGNAAAAADIERELERKPSLQAQQQQLMQCASECQLILLFLLKCCCPQVQPLHVS